MKAAAVALEKAEQAASRISNAVFVSASARSQARVRLSRLEQALAQHQATEKQRKMGCCRLQSPLKAVVEAGNSRYMSGQAIDLAKDLLAGKELEVIVSEDQKAMDRHYGSHKLGNEVDDLVPFRLWDRERTAIDILKAAISLETKAAATQIKTAVEQLSGDISEARSSVARAFVDLLSRMRDAIEPERALLGLEPDELRLLRPKPFPAEILSDQAISWFVDARAAGLITTEELDDVRGESRAVRRETLSA
jgi:hypothetical protein